MAETDPKSVQDLTAVVRPRPGCRGWGEPGKEGQTLFWMGLGGAAPREALLAMEGAEGEGALIPSRSVTPQNPPRD